MKKRISNIELLRIIAMFMIVASHLACHGVQHCNDSINAYKIWQAGSTFNKIFVSFLTPGGMIGVACFFMITGYFNIEKNSFSLKKVVLQGSFYGLFSVLLLVVAKIMKYNFEDIDFSVLFSTAVKSIFVPITNGNVWWFLTAYVYLMLLTPFLNRVAQKLNKKGYLFFILFVWLVVYSLDGTLFGLYWSVQRGVLFYLIGGYIKINIDVKRFKAKSKEKIILTLVAVLSWVVDFAAMFVTDGKRYIVNNKPGNIMDTIGVVFGNGFILAIPVVICSISIFVLFLSFEFENKFVNNIAKTTFGVYLIHDSVFARSFIWHGILKVDTVLYKSGLFPVYAMCSIVAVFIICSFVDMIRLKFIETHMINVVDNIIHHFTTL